MMGKRVEPIMERSIEIGLTGYKSQNHAEKTSEDRKQAVTARRGSHDPEAASDELICIGNADWYRAWNLPSGQ